MKKIQLIALLYFACGCLFAQSADQKAVATAVETLRTGMLNANKPILEKLTSDSLTYGHSTGVIQNKVTFMDDLVSGKSHFTRIDLTHQIIHIIGNIAVVRHEMHADVNGGQVDLGVLQIWIKDKGNWRLLARQAFKLPS